MAKRPKFDRRLLGTWRSDRRRTFRDHKPPLGATPEGQRRFRSLFGKLEVRWGYRLVHSDYAGSREVMPYELLASDSTSVVVRVPSIVAGESELQQIHFEGGCYWVWAHSVREYFRKIGPSP